jgi:hypothetical protein
MDNDNVYWVFSAAAQSISAFVAFLLTGYALVHSLMETARQKDDSLDEIHATLRKTFHKRLTVLAWFTGSAVVLSLAMAYVNRWTFQGKVFLEIFTSVIDLIAIAGGLAFVVSIVDPARYEKAATKALEAEKGELRLTGPRTSSAEFFDAFRHLERLVRDYLRNKDLYVPSKGAPRMSYSFRQMIEALYQNEIIDRALFEELVDINKYRNLVFHGHVQDADESMVKRARAAAARIANLLESRSKEMDDEQASKAQNNKIASNGLPDKGDELA